MGKPEQKLQSSIVISFSQEMPEKRGQLWATMNRTLSAKDGQKQLAMGLFSGVSDLCFFDYPNRFVGIELKSPGTTHSINHLKKQISWGRTIEENGGEYCFVLSLSGFWAVIDRIPHPDVLSLLEVSNLVNNCKVKSLKF